MTNIITRIGHGPRGMRKMGRGGCDLAFHRGSNRVSSLKIAPPRPAAPDDP
jgi:hypothetical protein